MDDGTVLRRLLHTTEMPPTLAGPWLCNGDLHLYQPSQTNPIGESRISFLGEVIAFTCYMLHAYFYAAREEEGEVGKSTFVRTRSTSWSDGAGGLSRVGGQGPALIDWLENCRQAR